LVLKFVAGSTLMAAAFFATGVFATTYECTFVARGNTGWVPEVVALSDDDGEIIVYDPIIKHFIGAPVSGRIQRENPRVVSYEWTLDQITNPSGQYVTGFDYRILRQKGSNQATLTATPLGYDNTFHADGKCAELKK
jgi:hypothetical protein